jgi:hypothetical protein
MTRRIILLLLVALAAWAQPAPLHPAVPRNIIVYFEFLDNANGVEEAVSFLFRRMLRPGDQLIVQSPARTYGFSPASLERSKAELASSLQGRLRGDISRSGQGYKQVIQDLDAAALEIAELAYPTGAVDANKDMGELFIIYRQGLANLRQLRQVSAASLRRLSNAFAGQKGDNHVIILFERELRPVPHREALNALADMSAYAMKAHEMFSAIDIDPPFDVPALAAFFRSVPLTLHFVYVTSKNTTAAGNRFESSGDIYSAFSKLAQATGGVCTATAEPRDGLEAVLKAWNNSK